jgi:hypothetical protein
LTPATSTRAPKVSRKEGDNEPTGLHLSVGSTSPFAMPGTMNNLKHPRAFFTRQHGDNAVTAILYHGENK